MAAAALVSADSGLAWQLLLSAADTATTANKLFHDWQQTAGGGIRVTNNFHVPPPPLMKRGEGGCYARTKLVSSATQMIAPYNI